MVNMKNVDPLLGNISQNMPQAFDFDIAGTIYLAASRNHKGTLDHQETLQDRAAVCFLSSHLPALWDT